MEKNQFYAPILLFVYKRLTHTVKTIVSLQENNLSEQSDLYIYSDGPKDEASVLEVHAVRDYINKISGFKSITIIAHSLNLGLAESIILGVTDIVEKHGCVIVLEDDMVLSPYFLEYMNNGLTIYENETNVASIHGYSLPITTLLPETYFMRGTDCWGWATWKRAWDEFEPNAKILLETLLKNKLDYEFNFNGTQNYIQMLKDQIQGKNNSWAIRWHASAFIKNRVTLFPFKSLVKNIGVDNTGEHCKSNPMMEVDLNYEPVNIVYQLPIKNKTAFDAYVTYYQSWIEPLYIKIIRKFNQKIKRCLRA